MTNSPPSHYPDIGQLGEDLVAQWLQSSGWLILHRRFSCRWGEIDIIAQYQGTQGKHAVNCVPTQKSTLAFVEVKTRSAGNWDAGGRSAITPKKQAKIWRTAGMFFANYPEQADYPCRFDVAIVYCQKITQQFSGEIFTQELLASSSVGGYQLQLQEYIPAAFDSVID
ncbi:MAG: YraN family protein [Goleter apudmare HA4340-LM2]|jgi:putative endonuclease|nr:YraN family protein [Goleter apudmare HA4340-LM2]